VLGKPNGRDPTGMYGEALRMWDACARSSLTLDVP
jgi:hypothetical protein